MAAKINWHKITSLSPIYSSPTLVVSLTLSGGRDVAVVSRPKTGGRMQRPAGRQAMTGVYLFIYLNIGSKGQKPLICR